MTADSETGNIGAHPDRVAWLTRDEMAEVDRIMIEDLGIELLQMMENAGRSLARVVVQRYRPASVVVLAGSGGNGGGGLAAARHLANRGVAVTVVLAKDRLSAVTQRQLAIVERLGIEIVAADEVERWSADGDGDRAQATDVIIDALVGYSLTGPTSGLVARLIDWANGQPQPVVALDLPSGFDATTGPGPGSVVAADLTVTLAAPKLGLRADSTAVGTGRVGHLVVADISVPPFVYDRFDRGPAPDFSHDWIVALNRV